MTDPKKKRRLRLLTAILFLIAAILMTVAGCMREEGTMNFIAAAMEYIAAAGFFLMWIRSK